MGNELYRHCLREENKMTKFKDLGLKEEVLRGITDQGFEEDYRYGFKRYRCLLHYRKP